jgi:hypothetical protein
MSLALAEVRLQQLAASISLLRPLSVADISPEKASLVVPGHNLEFVHSLRRCHAWSKLEAFALFQDSDEQRSQKWLVVGKAPPRQTHQASMSLHAWPPGL